MSEVMTLGIIGMPFEMAMGDDLSRRQFHSRAQGLMADHDRLEQERDQHREMAGCMDLFRKDMIAVGVVDKSCSPMFMTEGVLGYIGKLKAERTTALTQAATLRDLLTRCKERLDPHRDAALWSDVCAALGPKP